MDRQVRIDKGIPKRLPVRAGEETRRKTHKTRSKEALLAIP